MRKVAPLAGAWIEIKSSVTSHAADRSLPSRERGLKFNVEELEGTAFPVAPLAGAWIEISTLEDGMNECVSLPSRERGLKFVALDGFDCAAGVAPLAGAWIEILLSFCICRMS